MNDTPTNRFEIRRLTDDDGGGWLVTFPELAGCTADGDTIEEAIANAADAERAWLAANAQWKTDAKSGKLNIRIPKSIHCQLALQAKRENVSLNTLIVTYLACAVGQPI
jgi:antitoxin HicB